MSDSPMKFIVDFLNYIDEVGIFDEYDEELNMMVTSEGVEEFIDRAEALRPPRLHGGVGAKLMRELTDAERERLIADNSDVVIDLRAEFAAKVADNGGARGILEQMILARASGNEAEAERLYTMAQQLIEKNDE